MPIVPGIVGTVDQFPPIYEPNARWCWWALDEIFRGTLGENKYIPKVRDYVKDPDTNKDFIVDALDPVTYVPTLRPAPAQTTDGSFSQEDILLGTETDPPAATYRVFLDTRKMPHTLSVDSRLWIGGSENAYCKIFRGSTTDGTGEVISRVYDSNGQFISENIPLELMEINQVTNFTRKTVPSCKCVVEMPDNEIVTAVFYKANGIVTHKRQLLVLNGNFIKDLNDDTKYVTGISLESPFMSPTIPNQIDYPLNVPMDALNLIGVVSYSDGTTLRLPVDGGKFAMFGLSEFSSTIPGHEVKLTLRYLFAKNEQGRGNAGSANERMETKPYTLVNVNPNNSYTVKLFGYPFWIDSATGYQMRWWMFNLDRNLWFDVSSKVVFNDSTGPYDPKGYGYLQKKSVSLNLKSVSGAFKPFIHTQLVDIVLNRPPEVPETPWLMSHVSNSNRPFYGQDIFAKRVTATTVNLAAEMTEFAKWKEAVYLNSFPLVNPSTELTPLEPTHFVVNYNGTETEYSIDNWDKDINIAPNIADKSTITIRFVKRTGGGDLQLAMAAMIVYA